MYTKEDNRPSPYYIVAYIEIPYNASEDYEPETRETTAYGETREEAEKYFYRNHPGLHENGYRYGSEIVAIENLTIGRVKALGYDL